MACGDSLARAAEPRMAIGHCRANAGIGPPTPGAGMQESAFAARCHPDSCTTNSPACCNAPNGARTSTTARWDAPAPMPATAACRHCAAASRALPTRSARWWTAATANSMNAGWTCTTARRRRTADRGAAGLAGVVAPVEAAQRQRAGARRARRRRGQHAAAVQRKGSRGVVRGDVAPGLARYQGDGALSDPPSPVAHSRYLLGTTVRLAVSGSMCAMVSKLFPRLLRLCARSFIGYCLTEKSLLATGRPSSEISTL